VHLKGDSRTSSFKINEESHDSSINKTSKKRFKKVEPGDIDYMDHANEKIK
jgi:hypothetical protein